MHRGEKLLRPALRRGLADVCGSAKPIMSFAVLVQTHSKARAKQGGGGCKVVGDAKWWGMQGDGVHSAVPVSFPCPCGSALFAACPPLFLNHISHLVLLGAMQRSAAFQTRHPASAPASLFLFSVLSFVLGEQGFSSQDSLEHQTCAE